MAETKEPKIISKTYMGEDGNEVKSAEDAVAIEVRYRDPDTGNIETTTLIKP